MKKEAVFAMSLAEFREALKDYPTLKGEGSFSLIMRFTNTKSSSKETLDELLSMNKEDRRKYFKELEARMNLLPEQLKNTTVNAVVTGWNSRAKELLSKDPQNCEKRTLAILTMVEFVQGVLFLGVSKEEIGLEGVGEILKEGTLRDLLKKCPEAQPSQLLSEDNRTGPFYMD